MKRILSILAGLALALSAHAQKAGTYLSILSGGTNNVAATATNNYTAWAATNLYNVAVISGVPVVGTPIMTCNEFDNLGVSFSASALAATTGNLVVRFARSMDGGQHFETTPSSALVLGLNGTAFQTMNAVLNATNCTHVLITTLENTNAVACTNITLAFNLKSAKFISKQATQ